MEDTKKFAPLSTLFHKPNIVVARTKSLLGGWKISLLQLLVHVPSSVQLQKNNELMKYIKNSECSTVPWP